MTPGDVGSGVVTEGWNFVWMAYVACWIVLTGYTASLWARSTPKEDT